MTTMFPRQVFLRGALGATAAVALGACRSTSAGTPTAPPRAPVPDWEALRAQIAGRVVLPTDAGYDAAKAVFNSRFDGSAPAAVLAAGVVDDVRKATAFASSHGIELTARSGGHSYVGASSANGALVVDVRRLPGAVTYDAVTRCATVPAATAISAVQQALDVHGRSIPTGSCPSVGIAGLTLGGGLGADARQYGLTCDALVSASVVLPNGQAVTASPDDHADLFWALRGGGGDGWGIVTSFTFRTFATTDRDVVTLSFTESAVAQVIYGWHQWLTTADRAIWGMVNVTVGPDPTRCTVVLATPPGDGPRRADDVIAAIGVQPVGNTHRTLDHMAFVDYFGGGTDAVRPRAFVAGSDVVAEMTPAAAQSLVAATQTWPRDTVPATAVIESLDGAIGDVAPDASAFPWRRHAACVQWYVEPPILGAATDWLTAAHTAVGRHSAGGYVNYLEASAPAQRYFGPNLQRLAALRRQYDPAALMYSPLVF
jgi:FAD/FMN-containing dehydrogenase